MLLVSLLHNTAKTLPRGNDSKINVVKQISGYQAYFVLIFATMHVVIGLK